MAWLSVCCERTIVHVNNSDECILDGHSSIVWIVKWCGTLTRPSGPSVWCLTKSQAFDSGELCWPRSWAVCDLVTHPELQTVPSKAHVRTKQAGSGGANQSRAVALSGMLMSLQVTGGQWAPHGPTPSPLAPCVSLSVHTHKETPLAQGHISNVLLSKRTGSPLTDVFVPCNVCYEPWPQRQ